MQPGAGFLCFPREEFDGFLWQEKRKFSRAEAWFDLVSQARYSPDPKEILINGVALTVGTGECLRSMDGWAHRWGWSKSGTARYLKMLEKRYMIRLKSETVTTRITICDYERFKPSWHANRDADGTPAARARYARGTVAVTKEVKKVRKEEKVCESSLNSDSLVRNSGNGSSGPPSDAPLFEIPLKGKHQSHQVYQGDIEKWQDLFPACDVPAWIKYIAEWNGNNPTRRKTKSGILNHITSWLGREQNRNGGIFSLSQPVRANGSIKRDAVQNGWEALPSTEKQKFIAKAIQSNPGLAEASLPAKEMAAGILYSREASVAG